MRKACFLLFRSVAAALVLSAGLATADVSTPFNLYPTLMSNFTRLLDVIDFNGDRQLSRNELYDGYYEEGLDADLYYSIAVKLWNFGKLTDHKNQSINMGSLAKARRQGFLLRLPDDSRDDLVWGLSKDSHDPQRRLFPNGLDSIRPDNIQQGMHSDCGLIAAIASMAQTGLGKRQIMNSIIDRQDGSVEVYLPGDAQGSYVVVDINELSRQKWNATAGSDGLWLSVLEKGVALRAMQQAWDSSGEEEYSGQRHVRRLVEGDYSKLGGMSGSENVSILTGKYSYELETRYYPADTFSYYLSEITSGSQLAYASIDRDNASKLYPELPRDHGYSLFGYDQAAGLVTLRNPWGEVEPVDLATGKPLDGVDDGVFTITIDEFRELFDAIYYTDPAENAR